MKDTLFCILIPVLVLYLKKVESNKVLPNGDNSVKHQFPLVCKTDIYLVSSLHVKIEKKSYIVSVKGKNYTVFIAIGKTEN